MKKFRQKRNLLTNFTVIGIYFLHFKKHKMLHCKTKCLIHANDRRSMPSIFTMHFSQFFCPFKYEMCYSTRPSLQTVSFNLTNGYLFTGDVELVNLSNLEVLNLSGIILMEPCHLRVNIPIIYFNCKNNFFVIRSSFSISQYFKYFFLTLSIVNSPCGYGKPQQFRGFRFEFKLFFWKYFSIYQSIIFSQVYIIIFCWT